MCPQVGQFMEESRERYGKFRQGNDGQDCRAGKARTGKPELERPEQEKTKQEVINESLQLQKAVWVRDEIERRRKEEDALLDQIFAEQKALHALNENVDENMKHASEGRDEGAAQQAGLCNA